MSTPFYDLASLVVVPSGYKASKVYAQKPLTTDGQLAFTRSTTATRVNSAGLIEASAINVPRLDYLGSTCPRLLLEPQRTNSFQYSEQVDNAYWSKIGSLTITANNAVSPDGTTNADLVTTTVASARIQRAFTGLTAGTRTLSCFVKAGTGTEVTINAYDGIVDKGAGYNLSTGVVSYVAGGVTATITNYGSGWYRLTHTYTSAGTSYSCQFYFDNVGTYRVWGFQFEDLAAYATSYIPTLGAAVTRGADAASKTGITSLIGQTEGTLFVEFDFNGNYDVNGIVTIDVLGAGGNEAYIFMTGGGQLRLELYVASAIQGLILSSIGAVGRKKIAFAYKANDFVGYMNGVQVGTDTSGTVGSMDTIYVGTYQSTTYAAGNINQALLFKTRLTNAQLAELTTI